jgi:hypothetical protein
MAQEQTREVPVDRQSPAARIGEVSKGYQRREQDRQTRRGQLDAVQQKNGDLEGLVQIQRIRTLLEGEQDREATAQQLSEAFTSLADSLQAQAEAQGTFVEMRKRRVRGIDDEDRQREERKPDLLLALKNLALLPATPQNTDMIRRLDTELSSGDVRRKANELTKAQAQLEIQAASKAQQDLEQKFQVALQQAAGYTGVVKEAKDNQLRLADRLEFAVGEEKVKKLLDDAEKALSGPSPLAEDPEINRALLNIELGKPQVKTDQEIDAIRNCIRQTGDAEACLDKGGPKR